MAGKKTEVSGKKASGQARKAEAAEQKKAAEQAKLDAIVDDEWSKGSKSNAKKEAEAAKKAEAARKKAEKDALLAAEEASLPSRAAPKKTKQAAKKVAGPSRGLDLGQLDADGGDDDSPAPGALNASGIDNALDALSLATTADGATKVDRHPERRFKAALAAFEERRLREMESDGSGQGLRQNQKKEKIRKEFERHPDNPFNQVSAAYDASKEELAQIKAQEKAKIEQRLGAK